MMESKLEKLTHELENKGIKMIASYRTIFGLCALMQHNGEYMVLSEGGKKESGPYPYVEACCELESELLRAYLYAMNHYGVTDMEAYEKLIEKLFD